ncbi:helix-turn-helix domain-containing protein [Oryzibacter oryziterrae]|uniref:helix-turn-helix domain-containing protein n=1 Tax=Oryzibacter oryziterrae TaxID=2766474 RepID=UPI001F422C5B|nr:helix-turn-helix transcriptional regulator [Oryzibacter oryziterrae]
MVNARQIRAARAWLGWSQQELADRSTVAKRTIAEFELGNRVPYDRTLRDLREALEREGIVFHFEGMAGIGISGPSEPLS